MHQRKHHNKPFPSLLALLLLAAMALLFLFPLLSLLSATPPAVADSSQIRLACQATRFPDSCLSSLSSHPLPADSTAADVILAAIAVAAANLPTAQSNANSILAASSSNPARSAAAQNCLSHLALSTSRLSAAAGAIPAEKISAAHHFAGAALLYQYDCWSALKYVNSTRLVAAAMVFLVDLQTLTSNALAMIAAVANFGPDPSLWAPPRTERDGFWPPVAPAGAGESSSVEFPHDVTPDVTVCGGGGGACDFETVQSAVASAPDFASNRFVIHIRAGVYKETVRVPFEKTNLVFIGDGMGKTVITGSLNAQMTGVSTYNTATVAVAGDGFMAKDMTFENTAGPKAHQAVAFMSDSDESVIESVEFAGHQDTLYARSLRQLYRSCRISGTVDFIFGNSATVFDSCAISVVPRQESPEKGESNAVTAHGRTDPGQPTGFVFRRCVVNGSEEYVALYRRKPGAHKVYLGRPWKEYSRTVWVESELGEVVRPEGWLPWRGEFALKTLYYGEYRSSGPGANATARVVWSSQVPAEHVEVYEVRNFIQGDEWVPSEWRRW